MVTNYTYSPICTLAKGLSPVICPERKRHLIMLSLLFVGYLNELEYFTMRVPTPFALAEKIDEKFIMS